MFVPAETEATVRFASDTLSPGARGRNGDIKTVGLHIGAGTFATAVPEVPFIAVTPINSKDQITRSCVLAWPMTDSPAVLDAVLQVQGATAAKRKAVSSLVADDGDPAVDLVLDAGTPVTVQFGAVRVRVTHSVDGDTVMALEVNGHTVHAFALAADDACAIAKTVADDAINWEPRP